MAPRSRRSAALTAFPAILALLTSCGQGAATPSASTVPASSSAPRTATSAPLTLQAPEGLAFGPDGQLYVSDFSGNHVFRLEADGSLTVVAGNGVSGFSGDGGPAVAAQLREPAGLAFDAEGNLLIADHHGNRIRMVDADGTITTVVGGGQAGDGGPATEARLDGPIAVAFDVGGALVVSDALEHRLRRIDDDSSIITTIAGNGQATPHGTGPSGDGEIATAVPLTFPWYLAVAPSGDIFVACSDRHRVYRIDPDGILHLVAGTGELGSAGDGGLAVEATLNWPNGLALGPDGSLFVSEGEGDRIRRIGPDGVISTYAGTGEGGFGGDGGPAVEAQLDGPFSLALDSAGNLFVADGNNGRVRRIDSAGAITTVAGG